MTVQSENAAVNAHGPAFWQEMEARRLHANRGKLIALAIKLARARPRQIKLSTDLRNARAAVSRLGGDPAKDQAIKDVIIAAKALPAIERPDAIWPLMEDKEGVVRSLCWKNFRRVLDAWQPVRDVRDHYLLYISIAATPQWSLGWHEARLKDVRRKAIRKLRPHLEWNGWFLDVAPSLTNRYPHYHILVIVPWSRASLVAAIAKRDISRAMRTRSLRIEVTYPCHVDGDRRKRLLDDRERRASWFTTLAYVTGLCSYRDPPQHPGHYDKNAVPPQTGGNWGDMLAWPDAWRAAAGFAANQDVLKAAAPLQFLHFLRDKRKKRLYRQRVSKFEAAPPLSLSSAATQTNAPTRRKRGPKRANNSASVLRSSSSQTGNPSKGLSKGIKHSPKRGRPQRLISLPRLQRAIQKGGGSAKIAQRLGVSRDVLRGEMKRHQLPPLPRGRPPRP